MIGPLTPENAGKNGSIRFLQQRPFLAIEKLSLLRAQAGEKELRVLFQSV
jgi:hypothetical protein